jgi:hypothetical protein
MRRRIVLQSLWCEIYARGPMLVASEFVRLASNCLAMIQEAADASNRDNMSINACRAAEQRSRFIDPYCSFVFSSKLIFTS